MIPIAKHLPGADEVVAVTDVIMSGIIAEGPRVADFEQVFVDHIGVEHVFDVNSGTAALHAALLAYEICNGKDGKHALEVALAAIESYKNEQIVRMY